MGEKEGRGGVVSEFRFSDGSYSILQQMGNMHATPTKLPLIQTLFFWRNKPPRGASRRTRFVRKSGSWEGGGGRKGRGNRVHHGHHIPNSHHTDTKHRELRRRYECIE